MDQLIQVQGLTKTYPNFHLGPLDLSVAAGEVVIFPKLPIGWCICIRGVWCARPRFPICWIAGHVSAFALRGIYLICPRWKACVVRVGPMS